MMENIKSNSAEKEKTTVSVEQMNTSDISGVLDLLENNLLPDEIQPDKKNRLMETGFIVYPVDEHDLLEAIENKDNHILLVARNNEGVVIGYVLAYSLAEWKKHKPDWQSMIDVSSEVRSKINENNTVYFRHIAIKKGTKGVGTKLEYELFKEAKENGYEYIIGEILKEPAPNEISLRFHDKIGFKQVGKIQYEDETLWVLVLKDLKE